MDANLASIGISIALVAVVTCALRVVHWVWLNPKRLERILREQGLNGNPYKFFLGDLKELGMMTNEAKSTAVGFSDDISSHVLPYHHHILNKFGKCSFMWSGPIPRLNIVDAELIKEIFSKPNEFHKPYPDPLLDMVNGGLMSAVGEKWHQLNKIVSPAFHLQKLKNMLPSIYLSCKNMIDEWETLISTKGTCEVDVWPYLQDLSGDFISRIAFGSNYEEGRRIFQLQKEQIDIAMQLMPILFIPGWRFLPIKANKRMREICTELQSLLKNIIKKREREIEMGEVKDDLLGILMESNQEKGSIMSTKEVLEECKLFYFTGTKTPSSLFLWTMVLLSKYQNWQARAREEVFQIFGKKQPDFDGVNRLKIVTMILHEVLRLYSPGTLTMRAIKKNTKLGNMNLPAGVELFLPIILLHYDRENWGNDAKEFKPERFIEGVSNATKSQYSFIPFGGGLRTCIAQNLAIIEAKMVITTILQHFSFELSPNYVHAPFPHFTLQPQHGAPIILHKI